VSTEADFEAVWPAARELLELDDRAATIRDEAAALRRTGRY